MDARLKRQFGAPFARAFEKSPTLVGDLKQLREKGISMRTVNGCTAWSQRPEERFVIGRDCDLGTRLLYFGHEAWHVLRGTSPFGDKDIKRLSRRQYINVSLNEETDCIVHEMHIMEELIAADAVQFSEDNMKWYRRWRRGGRAAIRRVISKTENAIDGSTYMDQFAAEWNAVAGDVVKLRAFMLQRFFFFAPPPVWSQSGGGKRDY
jgi:hypothetical protein